MHRGTPHPRDGHRGVAREARQHGRTGPGHVPGITRTDIHAALAYYYDNVEEIENEFRKDEEWARWAEGNLPSLIPPELKEQLGG